MNGFAGTEKSYLIDIISTHLYHIQRDLQRRELNNINTQSHLTDSEESVFRTAPTGVAAFNINGSTLHSLLKLPVKGKLNPLKDNNLLSLQLKFKNNHFLIVDEKSMLGLKQLN